MYAISRAFLVFALSTLCAWPQSACTAPGALRSLSGLWKYDDPRSPTPSLQNLYFIQNPDNSVTGAFSGVPPFHPNLNGTFQGGTFNPTTNQFNATLNVKEPQLDASGKPIPGQFVTGTGPVKVTLSADGNTLSGNYDETFQAPGGPPFHQVVPLSWTRQSGWPALVPAIVMMQGSAGGSAVIDNSTLTVVNCGPGSISVTTSGSSGAPWLTVSPQTSNLAGGPTSQVLTLTATPGTLAVQSTPYSADVTVSTAFSLPPPPDVPSGRPQTATVTTKSTVQFTIGAVPLSLTNVGPTPGAELESDTDLRFGGTIQWTLGSGQVADVTLEVVDAANPGGVSFGFNALRATQAGTFRSDFIISSFQIPQSAIDSGLKTVRVRAVIKLPNGTPIIVNGGDYPVYPRARLSVGTFTKEVWTGALTGLKAFLYYQGGARGRSKITVQLFGPNGTPLSPPVPDSVVTLSPGQPFYFVSFSGTNVPVADNIQIRAVLGGTPTTDEIVSTAAISIFPPPTDISLRLGTLNVDDFIADASPLFVYPNQPVSSTNGSRPFVQFRCQYLGTGEESELEGPSGVMSEGSGCGIGITIDNVIAGSFGMPLTFKGRISNAAGQFLEASVQLPVNQFTIITSSQSSNLSPPQFSATIRYSLGPAGPARLEAHLNIDSVSSPFIEPITVLCRDNLAPGSSDDIPCTIAPSQVLPQDTTGVTIKYLLIQLGSGAVLTSASRSYPTRRQVNLAAGSISPIQAGLTMVKPTTNNIPSDITLSSETSAFSIFGVPLPTSAPNAPNFRSRSASPRFGTPVSAGLLSGIRLTQQFSPPIPDDGNFVAQMTMSYSSALLPDIPGFSEANLQLVSFDPAARLLLMYPSTVDTSAKTVTATIGGLAPYYSLAVANSTLGTHLAFPLVPVNSDSAALAFFNAGSGDALVNIGAYDFSGTAPANPVSVPLGVGQQARGAFTDLLGGAVPLAGWIEAKSDSRLIHGLAFIAEGSGIEAAPIARSSVAAVLTSVEADDTASTELHVANPTPFDNQITFELHDKSGAILDQSQVPLGPKADFSGGLASLFSNATPPWAGYVVVRGTQPVVAASLTRVGRALSALNGWPLDAGSTEAVKLYAPYFETGGSLSRTDITLVNPTPFPAQVLIHASGANGSTIGRTATVTLAPGAQYRGEIGEALGLDRASLATGAVIVESAITGIIGNLTIGDFGAPIFRQTSLALTSAPASSLVIPYVVNGNGLGMNVALMNTGSGKATAQVTVTGPDGSIAGTATLTIPAGGGSLVSQPLSGLIAASAGQIGGAILINSDQPLAAAAIVAADTPLGDIAAIPAQPK